MICPECDWWQDWDDDPTAVCSFCGSVLSATDDDPQEAHEAVAQAKSE